MEITLGIETFKEFDFSETDLDEISSCMKQGVYFVDPPQVIGRVMYRYSSLSSELLRLPTKKQYLLKKVLIFSVPILLWSLFTWRMFPSAIEAFDMGYHASANEIFGVIQIIFTNLLFACLFFAWAFKIGHKQTLKCYYVGERGLSFAKQENYLGANIYEKNILFQNVKLKMSEWCYKINLETRARSKEVLFKDKRNGDVISILIERSYIDGYEGLCKYLLCKEAIRQYYYATQK